MGAGRKQAIHRRDLNTRRNAARAAFRTRYPNGYSSMRPVRKPPNPVVSALSVLVVTTMTVLIAGFLLRNQFEIVHVLTDGRTAQATVTAVRCDRGAKSSTGDVTVTFTDLRGKAHTVAHTSDTFGCYDHYAVGDIIAIRYAPSDPTAILTQQELTDIPFALALYALGDVIFIIGPPILLVWLTLERGVPWMRRRWAAWRASGAQSAADAS